MNIHEINQAAAIVRATPILPGATVVFEHEGRDHILGVAGPGFEARLEAITRSLIRSGSAFRVQPVGRH